MLVVGSSGNVELKQSGDLVYLYSILGSHRYGTGAA